MAKTSSTPAQKSIGDKILDLSRRPELGALAGTVIVYVFFSIFGGSQFTDLGGVSAWANTAAELLIIALPVGLLMIAGEFDLSVGSIVAGSSVTLALVSGFWGLPTWIGVLCALALGVGAGYLNGLMVTRTKVPSFIVTLAMQFGLAGLTLGLVRLITLTTAIPLKDDSFIHTIFGGKFGIGEGAPDQFENAIFWAIAVALVVVWILQVSPYGNWIFALGGDVISARAAGVPVEKTKIVLFMSTGFGAAMVGVIQALLYNGTSTSGGQSFVFNSVIAVVIGGVLLTGGYGSVIGIVLGTCTFAIVNQGVYYTGWDSDWAALILGILLLSAVLMNNTFRRLALSGGKKKEVKKNV
jgi:simple sugar transport system permease protein